MLPGLHTALVGFGRSSLVGAFNPSDKNASVVLSNGNLTMTATGVQNIAVRSTNSASGGLFYFEMRVDSGGFVGVGNASGDLASFPGGDANSVGYSVALGNIYKNGSVQTTMATAAATDVIGVSVNITGGTVAFNKNGGAFSSTVALPAGAIFIMCGGSNSAALTMQSATYALPSGYTYWGN